MPTVFRELLSSKKFVFAFLGLIVAVSCTYAHVLTHEEGVRIATVLLGIYLAAQGVTDMGKGAAALEISERENIFPRPSDWTQPKPSPATESLTGPETPGMVSPTTTDSSDTSPDSLKPDEVITKPEGDPFKPGDSAPADEKKG